jgi:hypothetical protein
MQMRIAYFPAEERVGELPPDVVQEHLLGTLKEIPGFAGAHFLPGSSNGQSALGDRVGDRGRLRASERAIASVARAAPQTGIPSPASVETFEVVYTALGGCRAGSARHCRLQRRHALDNELGSEGRRRTRSRRRSTVSTTTTLLILGLTVSKQPRHSRRSSSEAERAALIGRLSLRADAEWPAELLSDLEEDEPAHSM